MVKLTLKDRFEILALLPQKGDLLTVGIVKLIAEKISVTPEETAQYDIKGIDKGLSWNDEGRDAVFDIDFTAPELVILKKEIKTLDEKREIQIGLYDLCMEINNA